MEEKKPLGVEKSTSVPLTTEQKEQKVLDVKAAKSAEEKAEKKKDIHDQIVVILKEYKLESEIPLSHEYWGLLNQYRGL